MNDRKQWVAQTPEIVAQLRAGLATVRTAQFEAVHVRKTPTQTTAPLPLHAMEQADDEAWQLWKVVVLLVNTGQLDRDTITPLLLKCYSKAGKRRVLSTDNGDGVKPEFTRLCELAGDAVGNLSPDAWQAVKRSWGPVRAMSVRVLGVDEPKQWVTREQAAKRLGGIGVKHLRATYWDALGDDDVLPALCERVFTYRFEVEGVLDGYAPPRETYSTKRIHGVRGDAVCDDLAMQVEDDSRGYAGGAERMNSRGQAVGSEPKGWKTVEYAPELVNLPPLLEKWERVQAEQATRRHAERGGGGRFKAG